MLNKLSKLFQLTLAFRQVRKTVLDDPKSKIPVRCFEMDFNGPVGLGPGSDKYGERFRSLSRMGFSYIEVGPVGAGSVLKVIRNVSSHKKDTYLTMCINKDHLKAFTLAYDFADMFDFVISGETVSETLAAVLEARLTYDNYKPVLLRITQDLPLGELQEILDFCLFNGVDGVIVNNTRDLKAVLEYSKGRMPIIYSASLKRGVNALSLLDEGADLIQISTINN